jgi:hypothetical protein
MTRLLLSGAERGHERTVHDLAVEQRLFERHRHQVAPRLVRGVAHADDGVAGDGIERGRGADHEVPVRVPGQHVAWVLRLQRHRAGREVDAVHVEGAPVAQIEPHQHHARVLGTREHVLRAHALERRQVAHHSGLEVGGEQVVVLVAVAILEVEQVARVRRPAVEVDRPVRLVRHRHRGIARDRLHPHVLHALRIRRQPREPRAVGGELREVARRVTEQRAARDQRRRGGGGSRTGDRAWDEQRQREQRGLDGGRAVHRVLRGSVPRIERQAGPRHGARYAEKAAQFHAPRAAKRDGHLRRGGRPKQGGHPLAKVAAVSVSF